MNQREHTPEKTQRLPRYLYSLQKRAPIEVCSSNLSIRPQEPRRPRFSFFSLHNVKEPTQDPRGPSRRTGAKLPRYKAQTPIPKEQNFAPDKSGTKARSDLKAEQWERQKHSTSSVPGI